MGPQSTIIPARNALSGVSREGYTGRGFVNRNLEGEKVCEPIVGGGRERSDGGSSETPSFGGNNGPLPASEAAGEGRQSSNSHGKPGFFF